MPIRPASFIVPKRTDRLAFLAAVLLAALLIGCASQKQANLPPQPAREFRGVWIATVNNIDWPSKPNLTVEQQQRELVETIDYTAKLNFNAIIFQVRPMADALYDSPLEPWSRFLTGRSGQEPQPRYDPLEMAIHEAHQRGLQLHAWINPYRAGYVSQLDSLDPAHIARRRPDLVRHYGKHLWLDPGEPEAAEHVLAVVTDLVQRYDIDGIHLDDYFYPYPARDEGRIMPFPDDASYQRYRDAGGRLNREDWRRQNVDRLVQRLYKQVKRIKPHVQVGISPFGIWRPGHPPQVKGMDQYATIYADARQWLRRGWCDYLSPQLYWPIANPDQSFVALLQWWASQNPRKRHLWPGLSIARVNSSHTNAVSAAEIIYQVRWTRWITPQSPGVVLFSFRHLRREIEGVPLGERLRAQVFAEPALVPESPWLKPRKPAPPVVLERRTKDNLLTLTLEPPGPTVLQWLVQTRKGDRWHHQTQPATHLELNVTLPAERIFIYSASREGRLSAPHEIKLDQ